MVGAAVLGLGGLILRYVLNRPDDTGSQRLGAAAEAGAVMALAGAAAGALIGGAIEDVERVEEPPGRW